MSTAMSGGMRDRLLAGIFRPRRSPALPPHTTQAGTIGSGLARRIGLGQGPPKRPDRQQGRENEEQYQRGNRRSKLVAVIAMEGFQLLRPPVVGRHAAAVEDRSEERRVG